MVDRPNLDVITDTTQLEALFEKALSVWGFKPPRPGEPMLNCFKKIYLAMVCHRRLYELSLTYALKVSNETRSDAHRQDLYRDALNLIYKVYKDFEDEIERLDRESSALTVIDYEKAKELGLYE